MNSYRLFQFRGRNSLLVVAIVAVVLSTVDARGQGTIDPQSINNGGDTRSGGFGEFFSTIGEPIVSDSLSLIDNETTWTGFWNVVPISTGTGSVEEETSPGSFASSGIARAYPNPFTSAIDIELQLAARSEVSLVAYDLLGREVERLVDGSREAGTMRITWRPEGLAAGSYLLHLSVDGQMQPAHMVHFYR